MAQDVIVGIFMAAIPVVHRCAVDSEPLVESLQLGVFAFVQDGLTF